MAALSQTGCDNPADHVPKADVAEPREAAPPPPEAMTLEYFTLTPDSTIGFVGSKVTGSHDGGFKKFQGQLTTLGGKLAARDARIVIDMASTWSDSQRLTGHLKSSDFFDVEKFPEAVFEATEVTEAEGGKVTITGNLTLHGVSRSISFPAEVSVSPEEVTLEAEFAINRFDFDIKYPGKPDDLIRKEVVIKFDVRATPGKVDFEAPAGEAKAAEDGKTPVAKLMERKQTQFQKALAHAETNSPVGRKEMTEAEMIVERFDKNGDGKVSEAERDTARSLMAMSLTMKDSMKDAEEFLARWDTDGDGNLSEEEKEALGTHYKTLADERLKEVP